MAFDYGNKKENGQYENYPVDKEGEYVAPIRTTYVHDKCGVATTISVGIAETYAKNPKYYSHTFCVSCKEHLPVSEFKWDDGVTLGEIGVAYPRPKLTMKTDQQQETYIYESYQQMHNHIEEMQEQGWTIGGQSEIKIMYVRVKKIIG